MDINELKGNFSERAFGEQRRSIAATPVSMESTTARASAVDIGCGVPLDRETKEVLSRIGDGFVTVDRMRGKNPDEAKIQTT
jgi:hypothetical protein